MTVEQEKAGARKQMINRDDVENMIEAYTDPLHDTLRVIALELRALRKLHQGQANIRNVDANHEAICACALADGGWKILE